MTVDTSELTYFINGFCLPFGVGYFMTRTAGDFFMLALQWKVGEVVIKSFWIPAIGNMASCTIRNAGYLEYLTMNIFVTGITICT